jgi:hypothetical protein
MGAVDFVAIVRLAGMFVNLRGASRVLMLL